MAVAEPPTPLALATTTVASDFDALGATVVVVVVHRLLERLLDELTVSPQRSARDVVVERLNSVLRAHMAFEEVALHPLLRALADDLAIAAAGEHRQALDGLAELNQAITRP